MKLPPIAAYLDAIARINTLPVAHSGRWVFYQGMLFLSRKKWWADFGIRHANHEGLDIGIFMNRSNNLEWLETTTRIPAMAGGRIINVCDDFLGQSVIIEHYSNSISRGVSVYSHLKVPGSIVPGKDVEQNEIIGRIADTTGKKSGIHCHLHISLMEIATLIKESKIDWQIMGEPDPGVVKLFNPMG
ncbi:MAG: peptidoglycan DD-metalloendopeptidase family protein [Desulfobacterium sp.]|nr:peptidoglycan DD-metalloendopeptidase family protein [Desulfobacterium sp.]